MIGFSEGENKPLKSKEPNMEYKLIADSNSTKLSEQVTQALEEGFELYGQPFTRDGFYEERSRGESRGEFNYRPLFCQVVVKGAK